MSVAEIPEAISFRLVRALGCAARDRARAAAAAAAAATFFGAAIRPATGDQRIGEFAELDLGFIHFGQLGGQGVELGRSLTQEIKQQRLAVEQVFDIDQHGWNASLGEALLARVISLIPVPLQPGQQQIVLDRDPPQQEAGRIGTLIGLGRSQDFTDFQAAIGAADDARPARVALSIGRRKAAHAPQKSDAHPVLA